MVKLLIGGSPCTFWSIAQKNGRETEPSGLGWELFKNYLIAKEKFKPDFFLYENNKSAAQAIKDQIKHELNVWDKTLLMEDSGARYIEINSALVSAQNRQRFYVHNCGEVGRPEDRGILLKDILESGVVDKKKSYCLKHQAGNIRDYFKKHHTQIAYEPVPINVTTDRKSHTVKAQYYKNGIANHVSNKGFDATAIVEPIRVEALSRPNGKLSTSQAMRVYSVDGKSVTQSAGGGGMGGKTGLYAIPLHKNKVFIDEKECVVYEVKDGLITIKDKQYPIKLADGYYIIRKLTVTECERLQTLPDGYTSKSGASASQCYKGLGNGWTAEVVKRILNNALKDIPKDEEIVVLSMYDGIGTGRYILDSLGFTNVKYYASEIDKYATQIANYNYPDIIQIGDAFQVREHDWSLDKII